MTAKTKQKKSLVGKMLRMTPDKTIVDELGRILIGHPELKIPLKEMLTARARLKVDLRREFGKELERFYGRFLERCLADGVLTSKEQDALQRLKLMFGLTDASVEKVHNTIVRRLYRRSLDQVLQDKKWDPSRKAFLRSVQERLRLPATVAERIRRDKISDWVGAAFVKALSDARLSPEEDSELEMLANQLGVELELDEKTKNRLDRYRLYWIIDNGEIPVIDTAVPLHKNEKCYFAADARWCELRTVTRKARYGAAGSKNDLREQSIQSKTFKEIVPIEEGRVYLTSKRVLFFGPKKQRSILLSQIEDFVPLENGIHIHSKKGASPFIELELGIDVFALILARKLRDLHS